MNIIILYHFYNQRALMHNNAVRLKEYGICVDTICIDNFSCEQLSSIKWPYYISVFFKVLPLLKISFFYKIVYKIIRLFLINMLLTKYDLIDFHAYYPDYNRFIHFCNEHHLKYDITLWGSDIIRPQSKELLRVGFNNCFRIRSSENLHNVFVKWYGHEYDSKYRFFYFGSSEMVHIDNLSDKDAKTIAQRLYGDIEGRKIVVCGYNGSRVQNHDMMIKALSQLDKEEKESIHVVLPMTYGATPDYLAEIKSAIESTSISYTILDAFLKVNEVAAIRKTADVFLFTQISDAVSDSPKGHLYCENVCIIGEWIDYEFYDKEKIFYIKTKEEDLSVNLKDVLTNYSVYQSQCVGNHDKLKNFLSWETTIEKQVIVYGE